MADPAGRLAERRRLDSQTKAARVIAALDAMVASGAALGIAALARNAGVSRRFHHPELRAEAERRTAQIIERHSGAMIATARVTAASLRAGPSDQPGAHQPSQPPRPLTIRGEPPNPSLCTSGAHLCVTRIRTSTPMLHTHNTRKGHASTAVTEEVYRHQLKPVITKGAETMNIVFNQHNQAKSA